MAGMLYAPEGRVDPNMPAMIIKPTLYLVYGGLPFHNN